MLMDAMIRAGITCILFILVGICSAGAADANNFNSSWDWLGTPIYSYGGSTSPYLHTYYPFFWNAQSIYSHSPSYSDPYFNYVQPYYFNEPYWTYPYSPNFRPKYLDKPWWIGSHTDLPKVLNIARSGSSVRIYSNGFWQTP
jgi:hypothetical protein